jgi:hypothetical protein
VRPVILGESSIARLPEASLKRSENVVGARKTPSDLAIESVPEAARMIAVMCPKRRQRELDRRIARRGELSSGIAQPLLLALWLRRQPRSELLRELTRDRSTQPICDCARFLGGQGLELRFLSVRHQEAELLLSIRHSTLTVNRHRKARQAAPRGADESQPRFRGAPSCACPTSRARRTYSLFGSPMLR